jgi:hypothetical protein
MLTGVDAIGETERMDVCYPDHWHIDKRQIYSSAYTNMDRLYSADIERMLVLRNGAVYVRGMPWSQGFGVG